MLICKMTLFDFLSLLNASMDFALNHRHSIFRKIIDGMVYWAERCQLGFFTWHFSLLYDNWVGYIVFRSKPIKSAFFTKFSNVVLHCLAYCQELDQQIICHNINLEENFERFLALEPLNCVNYADMKIQFFTWK